MDTLVQKFVDWCARKDAAALIEHTVVEGVLGVAVTAVGQIPAPYSLYVVPLSMAVLTPVIAAIGNGGSPTGTTAATPVVATAAEATTTTEADTTTAIDATTTETETETATTNPVVATEGTTAVTSPTSAVTNPTTASTDAASVAAATDTTATTDKEA